MLISLVSLGIFAIFIFVILSFLSQKNSFSLYKKKEFLTKNESEFLLRLEKALPEYRIHCQVAMGSLVDANIDKRQDFRKYMSIRGSYAQKIIDYVIQDKISGNIIVLVELDDRTHDKNKDAWRDKITSNAGYITLRYLSKKKPSIDEIRENILDIINKKA